MDRNKIAHVLGSKAEATYEVREPYALRYTSLLATMGLLEIFLLIVLTYWLLASSRKRTGTKKQPTQPARPRDPDLEEALREIREALNRSTPDVPSSPKAASEFHNLEAAHSLETREAQQSASTRLPISTEALPLEATRTQTHARSRFWLERLRRRKEAQMGIVLAELLGPPRARKPWRPRIGSDYLR